MSRKTMLEGGKKEEILNVARKLFFEKGYDAVTIRMIQREVGSEPGLFYYYFESKEEVFDLAVKQFVKGYLPELEAVLEKGRKNPQLMLTYFFAFIHQKTISFRKEYGDSLHWTVRYAIRETALEFMEAYLEEGIQVMVDAGMPEPKVARNVLAILLVHGFGSMIFHIEENRYQEMIGDMQTAVHMLLGSPNMLKENIEKRKVYLTSTNPMDEMLPKEGGGIRNGAKQK